MDVGQADCQRQYRVLVAPGSRATLKQSANLWPNWLRSRIPS